MTRFIEVMRCYEHGHPGFGQRLDEAPEAAARQRVDAGCRLVEEEHPWVVQDAAGERQALTDGPGEVAHLSVELTTESNEPRGALDCVALGRPAQAVCPAEERKILEARHVGVERKALGHVSDALRHGPRIVAHVDPRDRDLAGGRPKQPAKGPNQGRFSRAVRTEEPENFPWLDREADVVDGHEVPERTRQIVNLDRRLAGFYGRLPRAGRFKRRFRLRVDGRFFLTQ